MMAGQGRKAAWTTGECLVAGFWRAAKQGGELAWSEEWMGSWALGDLEYMAGLVRAGEGGHTLAALGAWEHPWQGEHTWAVLGAWEHPWEGDRMWAVLGAWEHA
jgi:hypothetical protein